jgi:hypothetical protein
MKLSHQPYRFVSEPSIVGFHAEWIGGGVETVP